MMTKERYIEYLINTPVNYTATNLAQHIEGVSHDSITDFLRTQRITASSVWESAKRLIHDTEASYLIVDDSVQEKPHARAIELVGKHYSGNKHGVVQGINVVNLVHSTGEGEFYPIDFRIYAPAYDTLSKNDHFLAMLKSAFEIRGIQAKYVLFDSWYSGVENLKYIHRQHRIFYTTLKSNRLISLSKEGGYIHLSAISWTAQQLQTGISIKLKEVPFRVTLFKVVTAHGDIEWVITNDPDVTITVDCVRGRNAIRWDIECLHRELKQLTGIEKCQCHNAWAQRNHIALCYHAWLALKCAAKRLSTTLYRAKHDLLSNYLMCEMKNPHIRSLSFV